MIASIDVGASLTKAAVLAEPGSPPAAVLVEGVPEWPTVLVLKRDRSLETGVAARNRGAGRTFRDRYHTGLKQMINRAGALDPLHREIHFGSGDTQPLVRGVATVLAHALKTIRGLHGDVDHLVLTHPVLWTDREKAVLAEAAVAAGCPDVGLVTEAEAAGARAAERQSGLDAFAVLDFGASTFDFAALRASGGDAPRPLCQAGRLIGGDDFDAAVLAIVRDRAGERERRVLNELAARDPELLRAEAELVKRALSDGEEAHFAVQGLDIVVEQDDFIDAIEPLVLTCTTVVSEALAALGPRAPGTIVLSGGTARVPSVREEVRRLAHTCGAELVDLTGTAEGGPVVLGALRCARPGAGRLPSAARPFTLAPAGHRAGGEPRDVAGTRGGVLELSEDGRVRVGAGPSGLPGRPLPPIRRVRSALLSDHVALASDSPAFIVGEIDPQGSFREDLVLGRLAATPARPDGTTAMAFEGSLLAWTQQDGEGVLHDLGTGRWRRLDPGGPVRSLAFCGGTRLAARLPGKVVLLDVATLDTVTVLGLPEDAALAVDPRRPVLYTAHDGELVGRREEGGELEPVWARPLPAGGPLAWTATGTEDAVIAYDRHDAVYRAVEVRTGEQIALRDAIAMARPSALYPSSEPGVVYARAGGSLHRLRLHGAPA
ncbi:Hsp70 family protein [Actinomadura luteofluorescens]|uniref:Hsp70 family protein n=1 Tax=Actinomadura luteofluorescens TaxID=46163 RepID=UPI00347FAE07